MGKSPMGRATRAYLVDRRARGEIAATTARNHALVLRRWVGLLGDVHPAAITTRHLDRYIRSRAHVLPSTRRSEIAVLAAWCRWAVRKKILRADPSREVSRPRARRAVPAALGRDPVDTLLAYTAGEDPRLHAIVATMLGLGLRRSEVVAMNVEDWDRHSHLLVVIEGKGGHQRVVPTTTFVEAAWHAYLAVEPASSGPMFRTRTRTPRRVSGSTVYADVAAALKVTGLKQYAYDRVCPHALRHTCLTDVYTASGDLRAVMALGGHSSLATASIYQAHTTMDQLRPTLEALKYGGAA